MSCRDIQGSGISSKNVATYLSPTSGFCRCYPNRHASALALIYQKDPSHYETCILRPRSCCTFHFVLYQRRVRYQSTNYWSTLTSVTALQLDRITQSTKLYRRSVEQQVCRCESRRRRRIWNQKFSRAGEKQT